MFTYSFHNDFQRFLVVGARRGVHLAILGEPGSGKSMILQPLELICQTMPPPEDGSSLPLAALLDAEIILWQDFEYNHKTLNFSDLLRLVVGERIGVRLPGALNTGFNNTAPIFYSALQPITPPRWGPKATRRWSRP